MTPRTFFKSSGIILLFAGISLGIYTSASGMLEIFDSMNSNAGKIDPAELSHQISKSMSATSVGLCVAFAVLAILLCCYFIKEPKQAEEPDANQEADTNPNTGTDPST